MIYTAHNAHELLGRKSEREALPVADLLVEADDWEDFVSQTTAEQQREALNYLCQRGFQLAEIELNDWA